MPKQEEYDFSPPTKEELDNFSSEEEEQEEETEGGYDLSPPTLLERLHEKFKDADFSDVGTGAGIGIASRLDTPLEAAGQYLDERRISEDVLKKPKVSPGFKDLDIDQRAQTRKDLLRTGRELGITDPIRDTEKARKAIALNKKLRDEFDDLAKSTIKYINESPEKNKINSDIVEKVKKG